MKKKKQFKKMYIIYNCKIELIIMDVLINFKCQIILFYFYKNS